MSEDRRTIGWAVEQMRHGSSVRRAGWNGKNMFIYLVPAVTAHTFVDHAITRFVGAGTEVRYQERVNMMTAQGTVVPWLCSQSDLLADDWEVAVQ